MKILLAGASGAVGTPLTRQLIAAGHPVVGITRSQGNAERLRAAGAEAVVADVMDRENLLTAVHDVRADVTRTYGRDRPSRGRPRDQRRGRSEDWCS